VAQDYSKLFDAFDTWCLRKIYGYHISGTPLTRQFETSLAAHQSLKWSRPTAWDSLDTWLVQPQRRISTAL